MSKTCSKCLKEFPLSSFNKKGKSLTARCKSCLSEDAKLAFTKPARRKQVVQAVARRRRVLAQMINDLKSQPCADCNVSYPPYVMDFDHKDPSQKLENVAQLTSRGWSADRIKEEIQKCDVVCANCHRKRTYAPVA